MKVVDAVNKLEAERTRRLAHPLYQGIPIPFTICIGMIRGGEWPSMVAQDVVLEGRYGIAPQETLEEGRADLERCMAALADEDDWFKTEPVRVEWTTNFLQSGDTPQDHPLVEQICASYRQVLGKEPQLIGTPFGTDGGTLIRQADTPAVVFGPGSCAHCADEYLDIDVFRDYAKIMLLAIVDWCGVED